MKRFSINLTDILMIVVVIIWGMNFSMVKFALAEIPPLPYNGIRLLLASAVLVAWLLISGENFRVRKEHLLSIILLSISGHTLYQFIFIEGINHTTASNTGVIFGAAPIMISVFSAIAGHERIKPLGWLGIFTAFTGLYLVIYSRSGAFNISSTTLKGDLMILGAIVLWAHYSVSSRPLLKYYSAAKFTTITMTLGSIIYFPFTINELSHFSWSGVSFQAMAALVYSGVGALSLALLIWFYSVGKVGNSQTAIYANLSPVFAVIFSYLILSEQIGVGLLAGAAIIFLGIFFTRKGKSALAGQTDLSPKKVINGK